MSDFLRLITLQDPNTRVVLLGVALLGAVCGVVGAFAVLRRRALVGDAVAHASLPGVCAAYFVVGDRNFAAFLLGALVFGLLAVLCITLIRNHTRIKEDAAIGTVLSVFFGLGIGMSRMIQNDPAGSRAGLDGFLFGKAAGMVRQDVLLIAGVATAALLLVVILYKELKLLCFDREFAGSLGRRVVLLDLALMTLICLCTVIGLPAVGAVLVVALLIVPAAAARFWSERLVLILLVAGAFGALSGTVGASVSALYAHVSAGPAVALAAAVVFVVSLLLAPRRGVVADIVRRWALRRKILIENFLRAMYELDELASGGAANPALALKRTWTAAQLERAISLAERRRLVRREGGRVTLTESGTRRASDVVRAHRLWELYLIDQASIAPDHVDRDADQIEHVLPPEVLARLDERLRSEGRMPGAAVPASPHSWERAEAGRALG
ncbi:Manganese transport system membrane protein MntC [Phycisphaerales bacterium]|nr:Manganese transport system membrane protein MntC [Phycisphaerales bacterium]